MQEAGRSPRLWRLLEDSLPSFGAAGPDEEQIQIFIPD